MAISSVVSRVSYAGNGSNSTPYTIPYKFLSASDLKVTVRATSGGVTTLVKDRDYTVTGAGAETGGYLTTAAAYPSTSTIKIIRNPAILQPTDYVSQDAFPAESHETALDRATMQIQRLNDLLARAVRFSDGEEDPDELPAITDRASRYFYFDEDGNIHLRSHAQVLADVELEIPTGIMDRPTTTFADAAGRAAATPDFTGQIGLQLDTGQEYRAASITAGDWEVTKTREDLDTLTAGDVAKANRIALKVTPGFPALSRPYSLGDMVEGLPESGGWSDDDLTDAPSAGNSDDYHGFPRVCWIPEKGRILVSYRVADGHLVMDSVIRLRYSDDMGANWTDFVLFDDADTDYRTMGLLPLQDGRILGTFTAITDYGSGAQTRTTYVTYSEDFGETWSTPEVILSGPDPEIWQTSGLPFQSSNGTILIPYYYGDDHTFANTASDAKILGSTDNGETWDINVTVKAAAASVAYNEIGLFQRPDTGDIVALIRGQDDSLHRSVSSDSGATWGATSDVTPTNYTAGLPVPVLLPNGLLYLLSRFSKGSGPNSAAALWYSLDYGATWETEGVHGAASSLHNLDLVRNDILPDRQYGEGGLAAMADGVVILVSSAENTGRTDSTITLRTWLNGVGSLGRQSDGLRLRSGGLIAADALTPPKLDNGAVDALTPTEGMTVYSMAAKCLMVYNGEYWEPQAPAKVPSYSALAPEVALDPDLETSGSLSTWSDQGAVGNDFTAAGTTPVVTDNALVGRKAITFGGAGDYSEGAAADWNFLHDDSTDWALFIPFKTTSSNPNNFMSLFSTAGSLAAANNGLIVCLEDRSSVGASNTVQVVIVNTSGFAKDLRGEEITGVGATGVENDIWTPQSWHVLALTYEADGGSDPVTGALSLYMDGTLLATDSTTAGTRTAITATAPAHIGSFNSSTGFFSGQLGRILLYKSLPTADQINRISSGLLR